MHYRFGDYTLDTAARELHGPAGPVHVEPQVHDVLAYLLEHRDRVVRKEELLDEVWGDRFVSESALTSRIKAARVAVGDSGRAQHTIKTSHGSGYRFVAPVEVAESVGTAAEPAPARRLPVTSDRFRGREQELDDLLGRVGVDRLITLLGPGGTGKTRLSIELAARLPADLRATFVDLAAVRDAHALGQALAAALRVEVGTSDDIVAACTAFLRSAPTVLIVDNCEHVAAEAASLVDRVLAEAPATSVIATSRVPLGIRGEQIYRLWPLPLPDASTAATPETVRDNPAVGVFVDRAQDVRHDFELTDDAVDDVVALCTALDGLPLALELAAGRMSTFGLGDLLARLDRRLDLLGDDRSGTDDRHRSLRAMLDWSYELLDEESRRLFRHLAVFPAGHTLDGIEWLGGQLSLLEDPLLVLSRLVEASLIGRSDSSSGVRYVQLETMRTFGLDVLAARDEIDGARRLADEWALVLTAEMDRTLASREAEWDDRIRRELPNLRQARLHLRDEGRVDDLVAISANLHEWSRLRDVSEIWEWADELGSLTGLSARSIVRTAPIRAQAAWRRGRIQETTELAAPAMHSDDDWARAQAISAAGVAALFAGELPEAARLWEERTTIDGYSPDGANAALCYAYLGDIERGRERLAPARAEAEASQWPMMVAWSQYITGEIASAAGDPTAITWLEKAVAGAEAVGNAFTVGVAGLTLCTETAAQGRVADAAARYRDLIAHWLRSGGWTQQWTTLRNAAELVGDHDPALALLIYRMADADPFASSLEAGASAAEERRRAELTAHLGDDEMEVLAATVIDRGELAERTRRALADLQAAHR